MAELRLRLVLGSPFRLTRTASGHLRIRWLAKTGVEGATIGFRTSTNLVQWLGYLGAAITEPSGLITPIGYKYQQLEIPLTVARRFIRFHINVR